MLRRLLCLALALLLVLSPEMVYAQSAVQALGLPAVGAMVQPSLTFTPTVLRGLTIDPKNPLQFDFIVDAGDEQSDEAGLKLTSERLINYFLASLTVPTGDLWVNLSPYEKDRIIPDGLNRTELGRDLLAQDYLLKQLTATMFNPDQELGKAFWAKVYAQAQEKFGSTTIPTDTFNKVWIIPEHAKVFEKDKTVYIVDGHLKVMLEADYLVQSKVEGRRKKVEGDGQEALQVSGDDPSTFHLPPFASQDLTKQITREIILPAIEKEINEGKNFAKLRQMFYSLVLAQWYQDVFKSSVINKLYAGQNKVAGIDLSDPKNRETIFQQYVASYKAGVFNFIKEEVDRVSHETLPRKYFSGGAEWSHQAARQRVSDPGSSSTRKFRARANLARSDRSDAAQMGDVFDRLPSLPAKISPGQGKAFLASFLRRSQALGDLANVYLVNNREAILGESSSHYDFSWLGHQGGDIALFSSLNGSEPLTDQDVVIVDPSGMVKVIKADLAKTALETIGKFPEVEASALISDAAMSGDIFDNLPSLPARISTGQGKAFLATFLRRNQVLGDQANVYLVKNREAVLGGASGLYDLNWLGYRGSDIALFSGLDSYEKLADQDVVIVDPVGMVKVIKADLAKTVLETIGKFPEVESSALISDAAMASDKKILSSIPVPVDLASPKRVVFNYEGKAHEITVSREGNGVTVQEGARIQIVSLESGKTKKIPLLKNAATGMMIVGLEYAVVAGQESFGVYSAAGLISDVQILDAAMNVVNDGRASVAVGDGKIKIATDGLMIETDYPQDYGAYLWFEHEMDQVWLVRFEKGVVILNPDGTFRAQVNLALYGVEAGSPDFVGGGWLMHFVNREDVFIGIDGSVEKITLGKAKPSLQRYFWQDTVDFGWLVEFETGLLLVKKKGSVEQLNPGYGDYQQMEKMTGQGWLTAFDQGLVFVNKDGKSTLIKSEVGRFIKMQMFDEVGWLVAFDFGLMFVRPDGTVTFKQAMRTPSFDEEGWKVSPRTGWERKENVHPFTGLGWLVNVSNQGVVFVGQDGTCKYEGFDALGTLNKGLVMIPGVGEVGLFEKGLAFVGLNGHVVKKELINEYGQPLGLSVRHDAGWIARYFDGVAVVTLNGEIYTAKSIEDIVPFYPAAAKFNAVDHAMIAEPVGRVERAFDPISRPFTIDSDGVMVTNDSISLLQPLKWFKNRVRQVSFYSASGVAATWIEARVQNQFIMISRRHWLSPKKALARLKKVEEALGSSLENRSVVEKFSRARQRFEKLAPFAQRSETLLRGVGLDEVAYDGPVLPVASKRLEHVLKGPGSLHLNMFLTQKKNGVEATLWDGFVFLGKMSFPDQDINKMTYRDVLPAFGAAETRVQSALQGAKVSEFSVVRKGSREGMSQAQYFYLDREGSSWTLLLMPSGDSVRASMSRRAESLGEVLIPGTMGSVDFKAALRAFGASDAAIAADLKDAQGRWTIGQKPGLEILSVVPADSLHELYLVSYSDGTRSLWTPNNIELGRREGKVINLGWLVSQGHNALVAYTDGTRSLWSLDGRFIGPVMLDSLPAYIRADLLTPQEATDLAEKQVSLKGKSYAADQFVEALRILQRRMYRREIVRTKQGGLTLVYQGRESVDAPRAALVRDIMEDLSKKFYLGQALTAQGAFLGLRYKNIMSLRNTQDGLKRLAEQIAQGLQAREKKILAAAVGEVSLDRAMTAQLFDRLPRESVRIRAEAGERFLMEFFQRAQIKNVEASVYMLMDPSDIASEPSNPYNWNSVGSLGGGIALFSDAHSYGTMTDFDVVIVDPDGTVKVAKSNMGDDLLNAARGLPEVEPSELIFDEAMTDKAGAPLVIAQGMDRDAAQMLALAKTIELPLWVLDFLARHQDGVYKTPEERMALAVELSRLNVERGTGGPFGAVIVDRKTGKLLSVGVNRVVPQHSSILHGEMVAIAMAQEALQNFTLDANGLDAELITSAQPCAMCFGAIPWSGVKSVVIGARGEDVERIVGFDEGPLHPDWIHQLEMRGISVTRDVARQDAVAVLQAYHDKGAVVYNGQQEGGEDKAQQGGIDFNKVNMIRDGVVMDAPFKAEGLEEMLTGAPGLKAIIIEFAPIKDIRPLLGLSAEGVGATAKAERVLPAVARVREEELVGIEG